MLGMFLVRIGGCEIDTFVSGVIFISGVISFGGGSVGSVGSGVVVLVSVWFSGVGSVMFISGVSV